MYYKITKFYAYYKDVLFINVFRKSFVPLQKVLLLLFDSTRGQPMTFNTVIL